jgi:arylsulfatase A-like enzyme
VSQRPNILFITLDQYRADSLGCAGHPVVRTPNLDHLAAHGVRFARHYAQAAPCAPGRAALYTGTYQMNNRVVANGTPLDQRFDNIALAGRRAGYAPALFGYSDQGVDLRRIADPSDARLFTWEGVLPGFDLVLDLDERHQPWMAWLAGLGYDVTDPNVALATESTRPAKHSVTQFFTDVFLDWLAGRHEPWFAHLSFLRPHPPFDAAGHYATMYDPADSPPPLPIPNEPSEPEQVALTHPLACAPQDVPAMRAQYYGLITEVDHHLGRIFTALHERNEWESTFVVVTADHAEQLGDQGLRGKLLHFESSYHILGIVRDPANPQAHGTVVDDFTENVDLFPTLCEAMGEPVPVQCDGRPLTPYLHGEPHPAPKAAAYYEFDWRDLFLADGDNGWPWDRRLDTMHLAVRRSQDHAYVHFGDGTWRCYDLAADPTWRTQVTDPAVVLAEAQAMLTWRATHTDRALTTTLLSSTGPRGRLPDPLPPPL